LQRVAVSRCAHTGFRGQVVVVEPTIKRGDETEFILSTKNSAIEHIAQNFRYHFHFLKLYDGRMLLLVMKSVKMQGFSCKSNKEKNKNYAKS